MNLLEQLRRNQLAIISLLVALTALGYNTWRNELTESNRNIRQAGFQMLVHAGNLQRIAYLSHYDDDQVEGNPRKGWAEVLVLQDLAMLMPDSVGIQTDDVASTWQASWESLGGDVAAIEPLDTSIAALRVELKATLTALD